MELGRGRDIGQRWSWGGEGIQAGDGSTIRVGVGLQGDRGCLLGGERQGSWAGPAAGVRRAALGPRTWAQVRGRPSDLGEGEPGETQGAPLRGWISAPSNTRE